MSIDVIYSPSERMSRDPTRSTREAIGAYALPVNDIVVIFGGWGSSALGGWGSSSEVGSSSEGGTPLATAQNVLWQKLASYRSLPGHELKIGAWNGTMSGGRGLAVQNAFRFIRQHFHPLGSLIVYGYSSGGFDAMHLAAHIAMQTRYYEVRSGTFMREVYTIPPGARELFGFVRIDLLITVDAATGPKSGWSLRHVYPSVRRNLNFYQTYPAKTIGSHGGLNVAIDDNATEIFNLPMTPRYAGNPQWAHSDIPRDTNDRVAEAIKDLLARDLYRDPVAVPMPPKEMIEVPGVARPTF